MKITFIVTGYNCERYVEECISSIHQQTYKDIEILAYNDASTDKTGRFLNKLGVDTLTMTKNTGATYGRYELTKKATGDVMFFLGMDDALPKNCAEIIAKTYQPHVLMTYGSWKHMKGSDFIAQPYPNEVWENRSFRKHKWFATAPQTARRELILQIPEDKLKWEGKWFDNCTDLAITFPLLEMCEKHEVAIIQTPIYLYRSSEPNNTLNRLGRANKTLNRERLKKMTPLSPIDRKRPFNSI